MRNIGRLKVITTVCGSEIGGMAVRVDIKVADGRFRRTQSGRSAFEAHLTGHCIADLLDTSCALCNHRSSQRACVAFSFASLRYAISSLKHDHIAREAALVSPECFR